MGKIRSGRLVQSLLKCFVLLILLFALYSISHISADTISSQGMKIYRVGDAGELSLKQEISKVELTIPKGETENFALLLENNSSVTYPKLTVKKEDLVNQYSGKISKTNIDERVIHGWTQKVVDYDVTPPGALQQKVDELLVRNEQPNLNLSSSFPAADDSFFSDDIAASQDGLLTSGGSSQSESQNGSSEAVKTTLNSGGSKKFYVKISLPQDAKGSYTSKLNFYDQEKNVSVGEINLVVNVAPFELIKNSQAADSYKGGCYINDKIKPSNGSDDADTYLISESLFRKRLEIVHSYGCEQVVFRANTNSNYTRALELFTELGFKGPIILNFASVKSNGLLEKNDILATAESKRQFKEVLTNIKNDQAIKVPILFYGIDEPNQTTIASGYTMSVYDMHKQRVKNIKNIVNEIFGTNLPSNIINQVTTSATVQTFDNLAAESNDYRTDYPIYNVSYSSITPAIEAIKNGTRSSGLHQAFYFQGYYELQKQYGFLNTNRFYAGLGTVTSQLHGSMMNPVYGYSSQAIKPLYDDFQLKKEDFGNKDWHKQMLTFVPAVDGFIPTLQAEAWRDGNLDLRYYLTYQKAKSNLPGDFSSDKKARLQNIAGQITSQLAKYDFEPIQFNMSRDLTNSEMTKTRNLIKEYLYIYNDKSSDPQEPNSLVLKKGFNPVGFDGAVKTKNFVSQGIKIFMFNDSRQPDGWAIIENGKPLQIVGSDGQLHNSNLGVPEKLTPGNGYYFYSDSAKTISYTQEATSYKNGSARPGWNLLYSKSSQMRTGISLDMFVGSSCYRSKLNSLISKNYAYGNVYLIDSNYASGQSALSCQYFKLLGESIVSQSCRDNSSSLSTVDKTNNNQVFWVYIWPSKATEIYASSLRCN